MLLSYSFHHHHHHVSGLENVHPTPRTRCCESSESRFEPRIRYNRRWSRTSFMPLRPACRSRILSRVTGWLLVQHFALWSCTWFVIRGERGPKGWTRTSGRARALRRLAHEPRPIRPFTHSRPSSRVSPISSLLLLPSLPPLSAAWISRSEKKKVDWTLTDLCGHVIQIFALLRARCSLWQRQVPPPIPIQGASLLKISRFPFRSISLNLLWRSGGAWYVVNSLRSVLSFPTF